MGLFTFTARFVLARSMMFAQGAPLKVTHEVEYEDMGGKFGAELYYSHRVDLHNELKHLATRAVGGGRPAEILLRREIVGYLGFLVQSRFGRKLIIMSY
jgi:salicylate hydroxylase